MARNQAQKQLFDLLVTRNFDPQTLDSQGKPAPSPEDATLFSFDYKGESGKDYGTVCIMFNDTDMTVFTGDNTGKSMEGDDKRGWFDFQAQLKQLAMKNLKSFSLQNLNKLKYSMQGQAALSEGLFESWSGKKDVSYNADATQARLMIKHKRNIGEGEARFRNIQALFIETADGERFKLPFTKLSGGRAMLEHVRQGGRPYDMRGAHIANIVNEMNLLSRFKRANQSRIFEGEVANLVEQANNYYATLQHSLKSLGSKTGYTKYFESWNPAEITDEDVIIEDLRHMFVEQNIDARVEQALPLLAKLQQESAMKEINVFEGWMNLLSEGTWALPDTKEKQQQLVALLGQELPVGPDATNATELLYDLLGDDELFDQLHALAQEDANADARTIILNRLEQMKSNPAVAQVIGQLKIEATPAEPEQDLKEFAPGGGHGDEDHLHKLARAWAQASNADDDQAIDQAEAALDKFGYGISEIEDGSGDVQLVPTGEYMLDWNDNDIIVFHSDELAESCHTCHKAMPVCECSLEEEKDTVERDPKTGEVKAWSHEGDWEKIPKSHGKQKDPRGEVTHMSDVARRKTANLKESRIMESGMGEVDILLQDIARGTVDIYNIYAAPKTNVERFVSDQIHDRVEELAKERPELRHEADIEKVLGIIQMDLEDEYGVDEGLGGQVAGSIAGTMLGGPVGGAIGGAIGDKMTDEAYDSPLDTPDAKAAREKLRKAMAPVKKQHPDHPALKNFEETVGGGNWLEETTALTGKYGHSGKLETVKGIDQDMVDRLKFLAGVTK